MVRVTTDAARSLSQQCVGRLLPVGGIELDHALSLPKN